MTKKNSELQIDANVNGLERLMNYSPWFEVDEKTPQDLPFFQKDIMKTFEQPVVMSMSNISYLKT